MKGITMPSVNRVTILGHLGRDPETKFMSSGDCVCNFSVATSESWKDKNSGEKKENTTWHRIVAWRKLGEICGKYLAKGQAVYVEGKLQTRQYDKDGVTHYATEIVASDVQFLGGNERQEAPQSYRGPADDDGQIPF
jgi:single-strand DNA-binding protein